MANVTTDFATTKGISNYDVTYDLRQVITCKAVTLKAMDSTKVYDGVASTQPGFTATALEATDSHVFMVQMADTCTITNVGTKANVIAKVDGIDITPGTTTAVGNYCVDVVNGALTITPAPLTIKLDTTKVYDATPIVSAYNNAGYTITGLVSGDAITAGVVTSSAADVATYRDSVAPMANVTTDFATTKGISNYDVTYDLRQVITCKAVTLKAMDSTKVYDGVASTQPGFTATALEATDSHVFMVQMADTCTITNVGTKANVIAKVDGIDITPGTTTAVGNYCVDVVNGALTITPAPLTIKLDTTKVYDATPIVSAYNNAGYTITGLVSGDAITAGVVTSAEADVATYRDSVAPMANVTTDFATTKGISNYDVTYDLRQVITCKAVTLKAMDSTKVYDGVASTQPGFTATALEATDSHVFMVQMADTCTITNVGTKANVIAKVDGIDITPGTTTAVGNYCVDVVNGALTITPAPLTIKLDTTKVYDGTKFVSNCAVTSAGYTITGLVAGDAITAGIVTSAEADVATYRDSVAPMANVTTDFATTKGISNYNVTYDLKQVITPAPLTIKLDTTKVYDATVFISNYAITPAGYTITGLVSGDAITAGVVTSSAATAATYRDSVAPMANVTTDFATTKGISNYNVTYDLKQVITQALLLINLDSTKVYDGTPFLVTYDQLHVTGLNGGDHLAAGQIVTDNYVVNTYRCEDGSFMDVLAEGFAIQSGFKVYSATDEDITASYKPKFLVVLKITPLAITIKANDSTKVYDGTALTNNKYAVTVGSIASTDVLTSCVVTGEQTCVGHSNNVPSGAVIMQGTDNVTSNYTITYANGTLTVNPFTDFYCPLDETDTLNFGECELYYTLKGTATVGTGMVAGSYSITNNLTNPLTEGVHYITWTLKDKCDSVMTTCTQKVTISYRPCPVAIDFEGEVYESVRIDCDCWTKRNLKSLKYSDGTDIPCVYNYQSETYPNVTENVNIYGRLYCFEAAVRDSADNGYGHIQGICPAGWYLPTPEKYTALNAYGADALKSPLYWIPSGGSNTTGFSALPAGCYNGAAHRYEGLRGNAYFWSTLNTGSLTSVYVYSMYLDCEILTEIEDYLGKGYSVRCIKEKE